MIDVKDLLKDELIEKLGEINVEKFRAEQISSWIYKKFIYDFDKMTNLPIELKDSLRREFYISALKTKKEVVSKDGTVRFLFGLQDGQAIESVYIPSRNTNTVCVSSQVGCKFACSFCASGKGGFVRNLRPAEIINQVLNANFRQLHANKRECSRKLALDSRKSALKNTTNVVFMGMGEPFDNYDSVLKAVRILNAPYALNIGQRKITISTCGIVPGIKKLAHEGMQVELSVSLHSASDKVRSALMGVNRRYPLRELMDACREYIRQTNRQITFEYVLIKGMNDSPSDAEALAALLNGTLAKVNLIPFNTPHPNPLPRGEREQIIASSLQRGEGSLSAEALAKAEGEGEQRYRPPNPKDVKGFKAILDKRKVLSVVRVTRGNDIAAACGQLRLQDKA